MYLRFLYGKAIKNDEKKNYIQTRMFMNVAWYYSRNLLKERNKLRIPNVWKGNKIKFN